MFSVNILLRNYPSPSVAFTEGKTCLDNLVHGVTDRVCQISNFFVFQKVNKFLHLCPLLLSYNITKKAWRGLHHFSSKTCELTDVNASFNSTTPI